MRTVEFAQLPTEKANPRSRNIDHAPIREILRLLNHEDQAVPRAVGGTLRSVERAVALILRRLRSGGRLFFAGAGASGRLGVLEAAECPPTFNTPPSLVQAVIAGGRKAVFRSQEGAEDRKQEALHFFRKKLKAGDVCVGIAASGVTPFVLGALQAAKEKGAATVLVACNSRPPLRRLVDCLIAPAVGPEVITGSTRLKAGTATKLVLNMLTVATMIQLGKVYRNWMVDLQPRSRKLRARAQRMIQRLAGVAPPAAAGLLRRARGRAKTAILMGRRGLSFPAACRKLKASSGFLRRALE